MRHTAPPLRRAWRAALLLVAGVLAGGWVASASRGPAAAPWPAAHAGGIHGGEGRYATTDEGGATLHVWEELSGGRWRVTRLTPGPPGAGLQVERWEGGPSGQR